MNALSPNAKSKPEPWGHAHAVSGRRHDGGGDDGHRAASVHHQAPRKDRVARRGTGLQDRRSDRADRAGREVNVFWLAWLLAFAHAALRAPRSAWIEQLTATAVLCIALPVLGFLVPHSNIFDMIARGDWRVAGVDLGSVVFGVIFASIAWVLGGKRTPQSLPNPSLQGA